MSQRLVSEPSKKGARSARALSAAKTHSLYMFFERAWRNSTRTSQVPAHYCLLLFNICFYDRMHQQEQFSALSANNIHLMLLFYNTSLLGSEYSIWKKEKMVDWKNELLCSMQTSLTFWKVTLGTKARTECIFCFPSFLLLIFLKYKYVILYVIW